MNEERTPSKGFSLPIRLATGLLALGGATAWLVPLGTSQGTPGGPTPRPGGGTYAGPGDTVPPGCGGCPPPPVCETCLGALPEADCSMPCFGENGPVFQNWIVDWDDAPSCMQGQAVRIHEITIGDLLSACDASDGVWWNYYHGATNVCLPNTCPNGVDAVFVYETIPFQDFGNGGVPTGDGGSIPVCGLKFDLDISYQSAPCGGVPPTLPGLYPMSCQTGISRFSLQIDCSCFVDILNTYNDFGLYYPGSGLGSFMDWDTVVFVVLIKCCDPSGQGTCS
jgi:hypothetical protein